MLHGRNADSQQDGQIKKGTGSIAQRQFPKKSSNYNNVATINVHVVWSNKGLDIIMHGIVTALAELTRVLATIEDFSSLMLVAALTIIRLSWIRSIVTPRPHGK